ncbi:DLW-39 family protein [Galactobacter caseinivorans]|nr:DLW-39 family protein [Galactobacter caseinivorans]
MKKLVLMALATAGSIAGYRWYQERAKNKASWNTATDRVEHSER